MSVDLLLYLFLKVSMTQSKQELQFKKTIVYLIKKIKNKFKPNNLKYHLSFSILFNNSK